MMRFLTGLTLCGLLAGCGGKEKQAWMQEEIRMEAESPDLAADKPSLTGADRANWSKQQVKPLSGEVPHHPVYFRRELFGHSWYPKPDRASPLKMNDKTGADSLTAATAVDERHVTGSDLIEVGIDPVKFAADLGFWPFRAALIEQPWDVQTSP